LRPEYVSGLQKAQRVSILYSKSKRDVIHLTCY
jgi:hypothetical protein